MARPRKKLTPEQIAEVETLASVLSQDQIADYFGIARNTFAGMMERDPTIFEQYKRGKAKAIAFVAKSLIQAARDGDRAAQIFFLKTQAGWRENSNDSLGADAPPLAITIGVRGAVGDVRVTTGTERPASDLPDGA